MTRDDILHEEPLTQEALEHWAQAFGYVATRYRVACSPGALVAGAPGCRGKAKPRPSPGWPARQGSPFGC